MSNWTTSSTDQGYLEGLEFEFGRLDFKWKLPFPTKKSKRRHTKAKFFIKDKGLISLMSVNKEEDLRLWPGCNLNPPPEDGRCMCCGKHLRELKPFGKPVYQSSEDYSGALLVKEFKWDGFYPAEEDKRIGEEFFRDCQSEEDYIRAEERLIQINGREKADNIILRIKAIFTHVVAYWLCRDCIILDRPEFQKKRFARYYSAMKDTDMPSSVNSRLIIFEALGSPGVVLTPWSRSKKHGPDLS